MTLLFDNDFADLFEVRGERRPHRGTGTSKLLGPTDVLFGYRGLDDAERTTGLHFDPRPTRLSVNAATWQLELDPHESKSLFVAVSCNRPVDGEAGALLQGPARASPRDAAVDDRRGQHRDLQQHFQ